MNFNDQLAALFAPGDSSKNGMLASVRATIGSLPMIARALLRRSSKPIKIIVDGRASTGSTDCETFIRLPRLPLPKTDSDVETAIDTAALMYGLLHHEVGHINYTDSADMMNARTGLERILLNIIEDVRQENVHIGILPASRAYLNAMNMVMMKQGKWGGAIRDLPPEMTFTNYLMTHLNAVYRHDPVCKGFLADNNTIMDEVFGEQFRLDLDTLLTRTASLASSRDALMLARDVIAFLQQQHQASQPQPQPNQQQQQDQQQGSEAEQTNESSDAQSDKDQDKDDSNGTGNSSSNSDSKDDEADGEDGDGGSCDSDSEEKDERGSEGDQSGTQTDQNSDASSDDGQDASTGSQSNSQEQEGDEADSQGDPSSDGQSGNSGPSNAGNGSGSNPSSIPPSDRADAIQQVLSNNNAEGTGDKHDAASALLEQLVAAVTDYLGSLDLQQSLEDLEAVAQFSGNTETKAELELGADHDLDAGYSASLSIRRLLVSHLDALTNDEVWIGARGRRLSDRHLAGCIAGDNRVFRNKVEGQSLSTAIMLVQDVSWSMGGPPIKIACQALYATALAMEGIEGIEVAAMAFPNNGKVIGFGESPRRNVERFQLTTCGSTPMAEAISVASLALQEQRMERKLMIVMTDGEPDDGPLTQIAIAAAKRAGIEIYGVGILTSSVQAYFDKSIVITDVNELPNRLVSLVRDQVSASLAA